MTFYEIHYYVWSEPKQEYVFDFKRYKKELTARAIFQKTEITDDMPQIKLYECDIDRFGCVTHEQLLDEKF